MTCEMLWRVGCDFLGNRKLLQHRTSPVGGAPPGSLGLGVVCGGTGHRPYRVQRDTSQGPRSATPLWYLSLLSALRGLTSALSTWGARPPVAEPSGLALRGLWAQATFLTPPTPGTAEGERVWWTPQVVPDQRSKFSGHDFPQSKWHKKKRQGFWGDRQHPKSWLQPVVWVQQLGLGPWWGFWEGSCPEPVYDLVSKKCHANPKTPWQFYFCSLVL